MDLKAHRTFFLFVKKNLNLQNFSFKIISKLSPINRRADFEFGRMEQSFLCGAKFWTIKRNT